MKKQYVLQVKNLSKSFPGVHALSDVILEVESGSVHALMGENGAGKAIILISSELPEILSLSHRILVMQEGRITLDAIADALQAVKDGRLDATVFQDAKGQGSTAVETAVKILKREPFERQRFIPFRLLTKDNIDQHLK